MITITVNGPRGSGKTATAVAITRLLREKGQRVRYLGHSRHEERNIEHVIAEELDPAFTLPRDFVVCDRDATE
jgi:molybdopterin-guanine dinucleotide biosynthesis protein